MERSRILTEDGRQGTRDLLELTWLITGQPGRGIYVDERPGQ
ncbi:hypothetical protein GCM10027452_06970 [Micromonospora halotolerans]